MAQAFMYIYKLPQGRDKVTHYQNDQKFLLPGNPVKPTVLSEMSTRVKLEAGQTYIILPAIVNGSGSECNFYLSMYFDIPVHLMDIVNVS